MLLKGWSLDVTVLKSWSLDVTVLVLQRIVSKAINIKIQNYLFLRSGTDSRVCLGELKTMQIKYAAFETQYLDLLVAPIVKCSAVFAVITALPSCVSKKCGVSGTC